MLRMNITNNIKGILFMLTAMLVFSCANANAKDILPEYSIFQILFFRNFFALIPLSILLMSQGGVSLMKTRQLPHFFGMGLLGVLALACLFKSLALMPLSDAVCIHFSETFIMTAISAWILKEKVGLNSWLAVAVGFLGVLIVFRPTGDILNIGAIFGIVFAIADALYMLNVRKLTNNHSPIAVVLYFEITLSVISGCTLPWFWITPEAEHLVKLVLLGVGGGIGIYMVTLAYHYARTSVVAPMIYSALLWNTLLGYLLFDEVPDTVFFIGAPLILLSGLYITYAEARS